MMTREQLFEHLMEHDEEFRKEVASSAVDAGMELYQAGLSVLGDKEKRVEAIASATAKNASATAKNASAKAQAAKARGKRIKAETPEQRAKRLKDNERIREAVVRLLTKYGPLTTAEMKAKMHPKTAALVQNRQHLHNAMYVLKQEKQIRWTRGAKRPNVKWEAVS